MAWTGSRGRKWRTLDPSAAGALVRFEQVRPKLGVQLQVGIVEEGCQVELRGGEQGVLVVEDPKPSARVHHQIAALVVAKAEDLRKGRDKPRDLLERGAKTCVKGAWDSVVEEMPQFKAHPSLVEGTSERKSRIPRDLVCACEERRCK